MNRSRSAVFAALLVPALLANAQGVRYERLLIRNATVIDGAGNPARGPLDILIQGDTIVSVRETAAREFSGSTMNGAAPAGKPDRVIDATGMYVMPGIIDVHVHVQWSRAGRPMPHDYVYKLLLMHGITTIRDPGSSEGTDTMVAQAKRSAENLITAPRILPYTTIGANSPAEARVLVRQAKAKGAKGLKVFINRPDVWAAIAAEAKAQDLPIATDLKLQETDAMAAARYGVRSIEHWYGIPDAAIPGPQAFPDYYVYDNELDRFRWAGRSLATGGLGATVRGARHDARARCDLGSDLRDLRGEPRHYAGADAAVVHGLRAAAGDAAVRARCLAPRIVLLRLDHRR